MKGKYLSQGAMTPKYKRILLKLSGEALMGDTAYGIHRETLLAILQEVKSVVDLGVEVAIVIGGGNIFRGIAPAAQGMDRVQADYMGMLATVMNALSLEDALHSLGLKAKAFSALKIEGIVAPYVRAHALEALEAGKVVIFGGGTGNPLFTTDTCAALRGAEMKVDCVLKATKVDGIYSADPKKDPTATKYDRISFDEAMAKNLGVLDMAAFALCKEQQLPLSVFSIFKKGAAARVVCGEKEGTDVYF